MINQAVKQIEELFSTFIEDAIRFFQDLFVEAKDWITNLVEIDPEKMQAFLSTAMESYNKAMQETIKQQSE